jgi:hypothetical protein
MVSTPSGLTVMLVIMYVSTFKTVVTGILYIVTVSLLVKKIGVTRENHWWVHWEMSIYKRFMSQWLQLN